MANDNADKAAKARAAELLREGPVDSEAPVDAKLYRCDEGSEFASLGGLFYRKVSLSGMSPEVLAHKHDFAHDMIACADGLIVGLQSDNDSKPVEYLMNIGDVITVPAESLHSVRMADGIKTATFLCVWSKFGTNGDRGKFDNVTLGKF